MTPILPDNQRPKCKFLTCFYGIGLAGRGQCPGKWWLINCPEYKNEDEYLDKWQEEYLAKKN